MSAPVRVLSASEVHAALDWTSLASALEAAFAAGAQVPVRHAHPLAEGDTLLLMPAWNADVIGTKIVTVIPGAVALGAPSVNATYLLLDRRTGVPRAIIDGDALTVRRTAAVSALVARYAAPSTARTLLMVGTGHLAPWMVRAHVALRPAIDRVLVWGRRPERAAALVATLSDEGIPAVVAGSREAAVREADIISCATAAQEPLVPGAWLRPGMHLDCVGGFTHAMREVDDAAVVASRVLVDSYAGVLAEAGDLVHPIARGLITREHVVAELGELARGERAGRTDASQITLFKSVGTALADLAAAQCLMTA